MSHQVEPFSLFTDFDIHLFREGKHFKLYDKMGSHQVQREGKNGVYFAVWAPNAKEVSVIGDFNGWNSHTHQLLWRWDNSGIWEGFIEGLEWGDVYKYGIKTYSGYYLEKGDPYALQWENSINAGSIVNTTYYEWNDKEWMEKRYQKNSLESPFSV